MEKLILTDADKKHLKNMVAAMKHFKNSPLYVTAGSIFCDENHPSNYLGVSVLYTGNKADQFMQDNGVNPDTIKACDMGYKAFVIDGIEYEMKQVED